ncbi:hypothetical protein X875_5800 [Mannheimia varigena USDA-ARS-USMARC-1388]|uniref:hypothetical protein n=1 Tax=Mannheimia varigena TaxID=85404 RepID=UPI0003E3B945|nr:hypothetical protein [Mannheimia varigena]AHG79198.1 hypothetical protein X875_5800 [Mannheimia varigena USDA-ARS-USMARC-1388]
MILLVFLLVCLLYTRRNIEISRLWEINMRFFGKTLIMSMIGLFIQNSALANDDAQISRYEQAKLRLSYEGDVGNLLQQLSQRLKVGFIAYDIDTARKVSIQNTAETSIKKINEQIGQQLSNTDVRFEKIGERLFMVISAKNAEPLLKDLPQPKEQFVGDIIFDGEQAASESAQTEVSSTSQSDATTKVQHIFSTATDKENIVAAKNKKAPQYKTVTKENLGLKNIRVTPLGTFLIFDSQVEAGKLTVKGNFEELAQGENIIAILHQKSDAPAKIEVVNEQGKKLILEAHKVTPSKKSKK